MNVLDLSFWEILRLSPRESRANLSALEDASWNGARYSTKSKQPKPDVSDKTTSAPIL